MNGKIIYRLTAMFINKVDTYLRRAGYMDSAIWAFPLDGNVVKSC